MKEIQEASSKLSGFFVGGYGSKTSMSGSSSGSGSIDGVGITAGLYGAREMSNGLFFDYYAAGGVGSHQFDLTFFAPAASINATGDYRYSALYAGMAVSGETVSESVRIRPRVGVDLSYGAASDASVSASQLGLTDTGRIGLERIKGATGYAEAVFSFGSEAGDVAEDVARPVRKFEFAPRLLCARQVGSDTNACGGGAALSFTNTNPLTGSDLGVTFEFEGTKYGQRSRLGLSYSKSILEGAGSIVSTMGTDAMGNAQLEQTIGIKF
jgi:hypothetical protein